MKLMSLLVGEVGGNEITQAIEQKSNSKTFMKSCVPGRLKHTSV
jgi:hypothetical protein